MVKLLDFKPEAKPVTPQSFEWQKGLAGDVCYGLTPDLPRLRFAGPQMFFIWNNLKNRIHMGELFEDCGIREDYDWSTVNYSVTTQHRFVPFKNVGDTTSEHDFYLPAKNDWQDKVGDFGIAPRFIQGRKLALGMKTIQAMDQYHRNTLSMVRRLIPILEHNRTVWVWTYVTPFKNMTKYDPHENKYRLRAGIKPEAIRVVGAGGSDQYEWDAYGRAA